MDRRPGEKSSRDVALLSDGWERLDEQHLAGSRSGRQEAHGPAAAQRFRIRRKQGSGRHSESSIVTEERWAESRRQACLLDDPWVVARNESGPRYRREGPRFSA